ncbi:uncharacterized protein K441DRAFT_693038 [Cenococcum geophilum 1.58]|uniref:uncharacterized protein n=1 Tax=Cenococcum geophilum 1.58 TaxID=794803 RepID=UPI00358FA33B|nr:hypothetical protein K441DRAFT_693038 [Cenococcum geophilum 1.58]
MTSKICQSMVMHSFFLPVYLSIATTLLLDAQVDINWVCFVLLKESDIAVLGTVALAAMCCMLASAVSRAVV